MEREQRTIAAADGRLLEVQLTGPERGRAVFFHTGTPSAGRVFEPMAAAGASRGLRHVCYSRPGYGASERRAGRTVADCAGDVAVIADELGIAEMFTVGWSGGGPHALACAALLGGRVLAAATIAGVAPADASGLDWSAGMGDENVEEFDAARQGEQPLRAFLEQAAGEMAAVGSEQLRDVLGGLLSDVDREALTGEFAAYLLRCTEEGLAGGVWGWLDDDLAFLRDWGFELGAIETPVSVWQGGEDRMVPFAHGEWLAANVPSARARLHPRHGHLSLAIGAYGELLDDLLASDR